MMPSTFSGMSYLPSLLGSCFLLLAAILLIGVLRVNASTAMRLRFAILKEKLKSIHSTKEMTSKWGASKYASIWFCLVFGFLLFGIARPRKYEIVEYHDVDVLSKVDVNKWAMSKADGPFLYTGCPDFPNDKVIQAGYKAKKIRFEERGVQEHPKAGFGCVVGSRQQLQRQED